MCNDDITCASAGLTADNVLEAGSFFGICGFASVDWITCELACQYLGAPSPCMNLLLHGCLSTCYVYAVSLAAPYVGWL